jgi:hypothetical protein
MPAFLTKIVDAIKSHKIVVAAIVAAAAGADFYFGLGLSERVIELFATAP